LTEPNPLRGEDHPWAHVGEYAKRQVKSECGKCNEEDIHTVNVSNVDQIMRLLKFYKDIARVYIIGHASAASIYVGSGDLPRTNISEGGNKNDVNPDLIDFSNLTDDAQIFIWGCRTGNGQNSIAEAISNLSGKFTFGSTDTLKFKKSGEPYIPWYYFGNMRKFDPNKD